MMFRGVSILSAAFVAYVSMAGGAWAAKPGPAPDTKPPATISITAVQSSVRALTLEFVATGDDGTSGTATKYDVRYLKTLQAPCPAVDAGWTLAERADVTKPQAAGLTEFVNVRALGAGNSFCVAISASDEVANPSPWAITPNPVSTAGNVGDWTHLKMPVDPGIAPTPPSNPRARSLAVVLDDESGGKALVGWGIGDPTDTLGTGRTLAVAFAAITIPAASSPDAALSCTAAVTLNTVPPTDPSGCIETISLAELKRITNIDTIVKPPVMAGIPGIGVAAFLVRATQAGTTKLILVERGPGGGWFAQSIDRASPVLTWDDALTYVQRVDAETQAVTWDPVVTWVMIKGTDTAKYKARALMLAERSGGVWTHSELFSRQISSQGASADNLFKGLRKLFAKSGGTLALLALNDSAGYDAIYAQRNSAGQWSYQSAGRQMWANNVGVALDSAEKLLIASAYTLNGARKVVVISQDNFGPSHNGLPPINIAGDPAAGAPVTVYNETSSDFTGSSYIQGLTVATDGSLRIAANSAMNAGGAYEARVLSVTDPFGTAAAVACVDRINGSLNALADLASGEALLAYAWGSQGSYTSLPQDYVYLARGTPSACSPP